MKKILYVAMALLIALLTPTMQIFAKENEDMEKISYHIYIAPNADEKTANGSKNKPFADIESAKEFVKTLDKTNGDIVVELAEGNYYLDDTINFTPEDSGTENCTIRYIAENGARVVISGGKEISGNWQSEGNGIYSISYDRDKKLRTLYVNNERRYMTKAEVKSRGASGEVSIKAGEADWAWADGTASTGVLFSKDSIPLDAKNADDIELMTKTTWNTAIVCVDTLEEKGSKICANIQMPYGAIAQTPGWGNAYQFKDTTTIYNVFEWLDEPGEFYFDKIDKKLYYYPKSNEDINNLSVVAPEVETLVSIKGENLQNRVQNISFEGIEFAHTDWNLCEVDGSFGRATNQGSDVLYNYDDVDWHGAIYRAYDLAPAAIEISSAKNISFKNNTIIHTGNEGISLINDATDITLDGNIVFDTGGSGILVGHPQHMYIGDKDSGIGRFSDKEKYSADEEGVCKDLTITNNLIKSTSRLFWGDSGVMVFVAENMLFQYNQVEDTTYSGLSLGWGWWNFDGSSESVVPDNKTTTTKNNKILNNKFINTITILSDAGAIYTLGDMPNTIISENYINHIGTDGAKRDYHIRGIHIDEGTKNVFGEKNVIDIDKNFAAIDCGDWGNKGNNTWDNNYSTSKKYKTTKKYEPDTKMTNIHTVPDANWDENAKAVIENAGIKAEYKGILESDYFSTTDYNLPYIPESKKNIAPVIVASLSAVILIFASAVGIIIKRKKKTK